MPQICYSRSDFFVNTIIVNSFKDERMRLQIQVAEMRFLLKVDELFLSDRVSKVEL